MRSWSNLLEAWTGLVKKLVEPSGRATGPIGSGNSRVEGHSSDFICALVPGRGCSCGDRGRRRAGPRALGSGRGRGRGDGGLRRDACPRRAVGRFGAGTQDCDRMQTDHAPTTEKDANRGAGDSGERERPTCAGPAVINESHAEFKGHRIRHAFATSMCAHPGIGKLLRFCLLSFCAVAWFCTRECPGGHWPACYDQTRGFPGEGPMTTLDSPVISGPSLTPTQELQTCVLKRRKTRGIKWESRVCSSCEKVLKPKQNRHTCVVCPAWACSAPCERALLNMRCCRMSGVATHDSIHSQLSEGLGSSAAGGMPQGTQNVAQAVDVQIAEAQGNWQQWRGHVAYQARIQVEPTAVPVMAAAAMEVESGRPMQVDLATRR